MQRVDAAAIETIGIPRLLLMDHAGLAVAKAVQQLMPASQPILICCGPGFNGGDGLSAARHLHEAGYAVRVLLAGPLDRLREEPAIFAVIVRHLGIPLHEYTPAATSPAEGWMRDCGLMVDALLGLGSRGTVREPVASLIALMQRVGTPVLAVDIPSGLDADTGQVQGIAVKAATTVTFGLPKRGCMTGEGPAHTGSLVVEPITIPRSLLERIA